MKFKNFKIEPSLDLSCLMSSMFIIILIFRTIKTTCFDNTILMAELEGKLPWNRWSLSAHKFPNSGCFYKLLGMQLKKGSVYFYVKKFIPPLLYSWIYNPLPNEQIISLIDAQVQLCKYNSWELNGAEYWGFFIAEYLQPNKLKKKFQSYILSFLGFFHWKAVYGNMYEGLHKSSENRWNSF